VRSKCPEYFEYHNLSEKRLWALFFCDIATKLSHVNHF